MDEKRSNMRQKSLKEKLKLDQTSIATSKKERDKERKEASKPKKGREKSDKRKEKTS